MKKDVMKKKVSLSVSIMLLFLVTFCLSATAQYDFALKNVDGKIVSLNDYPEAKGFIIVFTCNHCPFAKLYPKRLNQLVQKYKPLGVPLIAISSTDTLMYAEDSYENMVSKARSGKYNYPYLYDNLQSVARNYKAERTPQVFVIWKENGVYTLKYNGAIDDNGAEPDRVSRQYVATAVDELLNDKPVSNVMTRSVGCKINFRQQ